jgi:hypothetical protein
VGQSGPSSHRAAGLWLATALPLTAERAVSAIGLERGNEGFKTRREHGALIKEHDGVPESRGAGRSALRPETSCSRWFTRSQRSSACRIASNDRRCRDASTNGCRARVQRENQECVLYVNLPTGISRESINLKPVSNALSNSLAERKGIEPLSRGFITRPRFCRPAPYHSGTSPLKAASRDIASQTFALYSQCKNLKRYIHLVPFSVIVRPSPRNRIIGLLYYLHNFFPCRKPRQNCVNGCCCVLLRFHVESSSLKSFHDVGCGNGTLFGRHDFHAGLGDSEAIHQWVFATHRRERRNRAAESGNVLVQVEGLAFDLRESFCGVVKRVSCFFKRGAIGGNLILCHKGSI